MDDLRKNVTNTFGFAFMALGLLWSVFSGYLCESLCPTCMNPQLAPCFFLFLFVGIIFIITGASLIISENVDFFG